MRQPVRRLHRHLSLTAQVDDAAQAELAQPRHVRIGEPAERRGAEEHPLTHDPAVTGHQPAEVARVRRALKAESPHRTSPLRADETASGYAEALSLLRVRCST